MSSPRLQPCKRGSFHQDCASPHTPLRFVMFSREARKSIPASIIDYIKARNAADVELHRHATQLLQERRAKHVGLGRGGGLPSAHVACVHLA
eukprot:1138728-Pelagomonas_calceolata.AAC.8